MERSIVRKQKHFITRTFGVVLLAILFLCSHISPSRAASPAPIVGKQGMVVSAHYLASCAGLNILKKGGNAIDAAVAMGYVLAVVYPCCGNLGGGGFMLIRSHDGKNIFIDFRETAPSKAKPQIFLNSKGQVIKEYLSTGHITGTLKKPYLAVGVPGTVMGFNTALSKYGTMPLSEVMAPAIELAEKGYVLSTPDINLLKLGEDAFKGEANVGQIFLKNGHAYRVGELLVQKDLASSLKKIAKQGSDVFYKGSIAKAISSASAKRGGIISLHDLRNYRVAEAKPLMCSYRGYEIITTPPPGSGTTICEILKILEAYPLAKYGFHSAMGSHYILEAMRFSFFDRNQYLGDPRFTPNPVESLLSPQHIKLIRNKIATKKAVPSKTLGNQAEGSNTTSYVVVDKKGNAVSVTYSLNDYFGAKVIPSHTGFFLNNQLADFTIKPDSQNNYGLVQGTQNLIAPNKRPLSSMSPTIITKDGHLFMVIGTPGGSTIPTQLVTVILNVIDYGMNIQEAEDMPRFHMQWLPDKVFMEPFTFSKDTQALLRKMGYTFHLGSIYDTVLWGAVTGILYEAKTHTYFGAMDSRRSGGAALGQQ